MHRSSILCATLAAFALAHVAPAQGRGEPGHSIGTVTVRGDPTLLRRMIRNLVENAKLHGKPPVEVVVERQRGEAKLSVTDGNWPW